MAEKQQPALEKLPIPPLSTTAYTAKTRKTNKTNDEKQAKKKECDRARNKTRINIGAAFQRWRELQELKGFKNDAQLATFLLDSYLRTKSENQPEQPTLERESSPETCESMNPEYQFMTTSPSEAGREASLQSSENETESGQKAVACQSPRSQDQGTITNQSENKENRDIKEDQDEELSTSLSVGDGRYLVDLGSSSEFVVDEECLLQLFRSCRECSRQCTVRKRVTGLKLVVSQTCRYCQSRLKWTNLQDDDDSDFQINGKDSAHGQSNSAS